jgi:hypothetical protein
VSSAEERYDVAIVLEDAGLIDDSWQQIVGLSLY